jgi:hypothetical protein
VSDDGKTGLLIELACECSHPYRARENRSDSVLAIIANDWGKVAADPARERKDRHAEFTEFRLMWQQKAKTQTLFSIGH